RGGGGSRARPGPRPAPGAKGAASSGRVGGGARAGAGRTSGGRGGGACRRRALGRTWRWAPKGRARIARTSRQSIGAHAPRTAPADLFLWALGRRGPRRPPEPPAPSPVDALASVHEVDQ